MKLTYWVAKCIEDHDCYSIRTETKREALAELKTRNAEDYGPLHKVTVEYRNGFDLLTQCTTEGGKHWERKS